MFYGIMVLVLIMITAFALWDQRHLKIHHDEMLKLSLYGAWKKENECREAARKDWLAHNKVKIYFNTINGITAAMTEADYKKAQAKTRYARIDKKWNRNYLEFAVGTYVFITAVANEKLQQRSDWRYLERYIAGPRSHLEQLKDIYNAELISAKDVFVPWSSEETCVDLNLLSTSKTHMLYNVLVECQIPKELHPLPRGDF